MVASIGSITSPPVISGSRPLRCEIPPETFGFPGRASDRMRRAPTASIRSSMVPIPFPRPMRGGPYNVAEGSSLALSGYGTDPDFGQTLTYTWDVNGDGIYGDATGATPTLTWSQLQALGDQ